ncbi:MAG TPA: hypothetical protein VFV78_00520 [Vicinamibacterales bacterium]|nr:hypothetical protein [Vicinamibacterales bacterium]
MTGRVWVVAVGVALGAIGVFGLIIGRAGEAAGLFILLAILAPLVLWPVAAIAGTADPNRAMTDQAAALGPAWPGLALVSGILMNWLMDLAGKGSHENYAALFLIAVMCFHAIGFGIIGLALMSTRRWRPAGIQVLLGYGALLGSGLLGMMF